MKNQLALFLFISILIQMALSSSLWSATNLGTINTITNGLATIKECTKDETSCSNNILDDFKDILDQVTTNQCIASNDSLKNLSIEIPKCPNSLDELKGLDHTYPSGAIFAIYTGQNETFLHDLVSTYLKDEIGIFNLILPRELSEKLKNNSDLIKAINHKRVNIIDVETMPSVGRWMQDSFEFGTLNGKPALYQLEQYREEGTALKERLACDLAKKCNIPYFIPPDMVDPKNANFNSLNSGGNLEVLPGGTYYRGIIKTKGFGKNLDRTKKSKEIVFPWQTDYQKIQKESLQKSNNNVIDLDVSFLGVGHVDEIINIVKTNRPAPCDFAVMMADPQTAIKIIEDESLKESRKRGSMRDSLAIPNVCKDQTYDKIGQEGESSILTQKRIDEIYKKNCLNTNTPEAFTALAEFPILKRENLTSKEPKSIQTILEENKKEIIQELKKTTSCQTPVIIPIPVLFRNGHSITPNLVNGVVQTIGQSPSKVILPRSYFLPFDQFVKDELHKYGVEATLIHDIGYHLRKGEVHCGTNTARICTP